MLRSLIGSDSLQDFKNCLGREVHRFLHATLNSYMHLLQIKKYVYIYSYIIYICTYICLYIAVFQLPEEIHMLVLKYYHIQTCSGNNTPKYRETWNLKSISSFSRPLEIQQGQNGKQVFFVAYFSKSYFIDLLLFKVCLPFPQLRHKFCRQLE